MCPHFKSNNFLLTKEVQFTASFHLGIIQCKNLVCSFSRWCWCLCCFCRQITMACYILWLVSFWWIERAVFGSQDQGGYWQFGRKVCSLICGSKTLSAWLSALKACISISSQDFWKKCKTFHLQARSLVLQGKKNFWNGKFGNAPWKYCTKETKGWKSLVLKGLKQDRLLLIYPLG